MSAPLRSVCLHCAQPRPRLNNRGLCPRCQRIEAKHRADEDAEAREQMERDRMAKNDHDADAYDRRYDR